MEAKEKMKNEKENEKKIKRKKDDRRTGEKKHRDYVHTRVGQVLLDKLGLVKSSLLPGSEQGSLGDDLVHDTDLGGEVLLNQMGHKVAANEADSSKNQHAGLAHDSGQKLARERERGETSKGMER